MSRFKVTSFIFFILYVIEAIINADNRRNDIEFLMNMIEKLNHSNEVVAHLCWKNDELVALSKNLSQALISHSLFSNFHFNSYINGRRHIFVLDFSCGGSAQYVKESLANNIFDLTAVWIIFADLDRIKSYNFYFPLNSLVYIVEKDLTCYSVIIIYKLNKRYTNYQIQDIAAWKPDQGFVYFNKFSLHVNRTDLMRAPIRTSYVLNDNDTLNHLWDYRKIHTDKMTKSNYIIISYLLELINASKVDVWSNNWGYINKSTKFYNGMLGDLMFDRADLAGSAILIDSGRQQFFKFIPPTSPAKALFVFQAPPLSYTSNIFILPFTKGVWTTFLFLILLSSILVYLVATFEWNLRSKSDVRKERISKPNVFDVIFTTCSVVAQKGCSIELKSFTGRIVLYTCFTFCFYIYTGFSGYILVLLQSSSDSITDLASLYDSKMEIGVEDTSYNKYYFNVPNDQSNETYRRLFLDNRIKPKDNWLTPVEGIKRIRQGFFAFHVEVGAGFSLISETFSESEKCKVRTCNTILYSEHASIAVSRNCVYVELFLVGFRRIFETGLQKREHLKFYGTKPQCIGRHGHYDSIRLMDSYFPFLILGTGLVLSFIIFISESLVG